jgi:eukaryotic-like serine/threonine-protein kinase
MAQAEQRYRVIERIAAGGMAEVYRAESAGLEGFKKTVAIKRVLPHLSKKKKFIGMFLDEARLSATLSHSNCVQVFDIGVGDETYFIVMEYVDGANLKALIEHRKQLGQRLPIEVACMITLKICEGLSYAHEARDALGQSLGVVHRDVSPPNVLITRYGEVKVVDFGLAKANSQLEDSEPGIIKGKFSYLSPEAALGETVDHRTDIFATGIILWEMLTSRRLFLGETDLQTVRQVQASHVPLARDFNADVPRSLDQVLAHALARDPATRYQTAREFGRDLNRILFELGRPVSSFDLAGFVSDVLHEKNRQRSIRPKQQTLIGSLIQDAIMSFTSLKNKSNSGDKSLSPQDSPDEESGVGAIPLSLGSFDTGTWEERSRTERKEPSHVGLAPPNYQIGDLASQLEDLDENPSGSVDLNALMTTRSAQPMTAPPTRQARASAVPPSSRRMTPGLGSYAPGVPQSYEQHNPGVPFHHGNTHHVPLRFWVACVLIVLVGGTFGAYMAGVFN